ncbi:alkane 1-monooxygenase [Rhodalgimonas zhirmunskyi]|uniref:Alkane 1-monooxygenase n=1 Tax=Rhodalgimonas zhirmunskyi TaxID=2964767 RepID=A0AAJ1U4G5_9RHOB|nr:alkane 1-monooxygenase [Rhodoalgimonas zhirmunskyi]MDQ2093526.1 alkane 1-monooxygenase [Rhodoalgimonas zhirmunskyi]
MIGFVLAILAQVGLLVLGALWGGGWAVAALVYITAFAAALDRVVPRLFPDAAQGAEFPSGARFSVALGLIHFALLGLVLHVISGDALSVAEKLFIFVAYALFFGQVSHPNAHELIHRSARFPRLLGRWVYISLLFGHHASAHVLVHHSYVGTEKDPNSPKLGASFYHFFAKAWRGSFTQGLKAETALRARGSRARRRWSHPYVQYVGGAVGFVVAAAVLFGAKGLIAYLTLALYAQVQILLADYVQHYGLRRVIRDNGKPEPVSDAHSWNSPHWFSSALMVNAPRHSDHHLHPSRPYPGLRLRDGMPILPHSLPVMAVLALYPPIWRRVMRRELDGLGKGG